MSIINEKPEMFGMPVFDFYLLAALEGLLFIICILWVSQFGMTAATVTFIITGGPIYAFFSFKKFLPEHFFKNLIKYFIEPRVYLPRTELNTENKLLKAILHKEETNG